MNQYIICISMSKSWVIQSATYLVFPLIFYWYLLGPASRGHGLFLIMTNTPEGMSIKSRTCNINQTKMYPLWDRFKVFLKYHVHGAYVHLNQQTVQNLVDTMNSALEYLRTVFWTWNESILLWCQRQRWNSGLQGNLPWWIVSHT